MPQTVRLWSVASGTQPSELGRCPLDLEDRLEGWIVADISILAPDLLVIGNQVTVDGGSIDILCLDEHGGTVIVELKRGRTPREVTAQVLDYASSVRHFLTADIRAIAKKQLGSEEELERQFRAKYGVELPSTLNLKHRMIIVGVDLDASTARIIEYLSDEHSVDINAATFGYFRTAEGSELIARVFLVEPEEVENRVRAKGSSKRAPALTYAELEETADRAGVGEMYRAVAQGLTGAFKTGTSQSSLRFTGPYQGTNRVVFSLLPGESSQSDGLKFQVYLLRLCELLGLEESEVLQALPATRTAWTYPASDPDKRMWSGFEGFFKSKAEVATFVSACARRAVGDRQ